MDLAFQNPDGGYALSQALRRENQALLDHRKALTQFNRLILDRKLPDEAH